ncbi:MAG: hypothetical protein LBK76_04380 [Verrucomicrobiales bacterium]|nr:hypothetical protein [Verrucomicrobiales bacterium]
MKKYFSIFILTGILLAACVSTNNARNEVFKKYQPNHFTEIQKGIMELSQYDRLRPAEFRGLNAFGSDIHQYQDAYDLETVSDIAQFMIRNFGSEIEYAAAMRLSKATCQYAGKELNNPKPPYHPDHFTRYWLHPSVRCLYLAEKKNFKYYVIKLISKENSTIRNNPIGRECYLFLFFDKDDEYQGHIAAMK